MKQKKLNNNDIISARYHLSKHYGDTIGTMVVGKDTIGYNGKTLYYYDCYSDGSTVWYDKKVENLYTLER